MTTLDSQTDNSRSRPARVSRGAPSATQGAIGRRTPRHASPVSETTGPARWSGQLSERVESIHRQALARQRPNGAVNLGSAALDDETTLFLHGDLTAESVPHLQAVLDEIVLLQPNLLVVDLSEVGRISPWAIRMVARCGAEIGGLVLRSPSPSRAGTSRASAGPSSSSLIPMQSVLPNGVDDHIGQVSSSVARRPDDERIPAMAEVTDHQIPAGGTQTREEGPTWRG